jgi:hypothetical protein
MHSVKDQEQLMTDGTQQPAPPATAAEARAVLDTRIADKDWGAKLLAGDAAAGREFHELQAKADSPDRSAKVDLAMSGADLGFLADSSVVQMMHMAGLLRETGFNELQVRETLSDREASQAEVEMARTWKAQNLKSKEFQTRWLSGDPEAVRQMLVANIILTSPLKKAGAA